LNKVAPVENQVRKSDDKKTQEILETMLRTHEKALKKLESAQKLESDPKPQQIDTNHSLTSQTPQPTKILCSLCDISIVGFGADNWITLEWKSPQINASFIDKQRIGETNVIIYEGKNHYLVIRKLILQTKYEFTISYANEEGESRTSVWTNGNLSKYRIDWQGIDTIEDRILCLKYVHKSTMHEPFVGILSIILHMEYIDILETLEYRLEIDPHAKALELFHELEIIKRESDGVMFVRACGLGDMQMVKHFFSCVSLDHKMYGFFFSCANEQLDITVFLLDDPHISKNGTVEKNQLTPKVIDTFYIPGWLQDGVLEQDKDSKQLPPAVILLAEHHSFRYENDCYDISQPSSSKKNSSTMYCHRNNHNRPSYDEYEDDEYNTLKPSRARDKYEDYEFEDKYTSQRSRAHQDDEYEDDEYDTLQPSSEEESADDDEDDY